jgi:hypothetical protein
MKPNAGYRLVLLKLDITDFAAIFLTVFPSILSVSCITRNGVWIGNRIY